MTAPPARLPASRANVEPSAGRLESASVGVPFDPTQPPPSEVQVAALQIVSSIPNASTAASQTELFGWSATENRTTI